MNRNRIRYIVVGVIIGLLLVGIYAARPQPEPVRLTDPLSSPARQSDPSSYTVTYRITGRTHQADVTYRNAGGNVEQDDISRFSAADSFNNKPWTLTFDAAAGDFVQISAQNGRDVGTIKCEILVNGDVIEQAESNGGFVIASCNGSVR